jgi:hypothetical protein
MEEALQLLEQMLAVQKRTLGHDHGSRGHLTIRERALENYRPNLSLCEQERCMCAI